MNPTRKLEYPKMDTISKLPSTIIETILCLIPIQEAARTSVLSKNWRHHWTKIPKLVFEEDAFQVSSYGDELSALEETFDDLVSERKGMTKRCKFFYAIYQVLLRHEGPIHEFTLSFISDKTCVEIDHILSYFSRNNHPVMKLKLYISSRLPSSFFSFDHLTDLYLVLCDLDHQPTTFNGFHKLTNLFIDCVITTKSILLHLLANSPLLKTLTLFTDEIQDIGDSTITNLFECFPMVESLSIWLVAVKCFDQGGVPEVLPTALISLKYLYIDHMNFDYVYGVPFLLLLIRSSPNLEKLKLQIYDSPWFFKSEERSSALKNVSNIWLGHLKVLEVSNLSNEILELDFVKLIMAKSPVLETVRIFLWEDIDEDDKLYVSRFLLSSQRLSPMVKVIFESSS